MAMFVFESDIRNYFSNKVCANEVGQLQICRVMKFSVHLTISGSVGVTISKWLTAFDEFR